MTQTIADLIHDRFGLPTEAGRAMPAEGTVAHLLSHRVQRRYKPDPISDETLQIVLAAALSAPVEVRPPAGPISWSETAPSRRRSVGIPDLPGSDRALFRSSARSYRRMRRIAELRGRPFPNDTLACS